MFQRIDDSAQVQFWIPTFRWRLIWTPPRHPNCDPNAPPVIVTEPAIFVGYPELETT
jgi:hypothetical protein